MEVPRCARVVPGAFLTSSRIISLSPFVKSRAVASRSLQSVLIEPWWSHEAGDELRRRPSLARRVATWMMTRPLQAASRGLPRPRTRGGRRDGSGRRTLVRWRLAKWKVMAGHANPAARHGRALQSSGSSRQTAVSQRLRPWMSRFSGAQHRPRRLLLAWMKTARRYPDTLARSQERLLSTSLATLNRRSWP